MRAVFVIACLIWAPQGYAKTCPVGFREHRGICLQESVSVLCPPGYDFKGGKCISELCPQGFKEEDGICVQVDVKKCPSGLKFVDGKCVEDRTDTYCPPGYKAYLSTCIPDKENQPDYTCPEGYTYQDGKCVAVRDNRGFNCNPFNILNGGHCQPAINFDPCTMAGFGGPCYGGYSGLTYRK